MSLVVLKLNLVFSDSWLIWDKSLDKANNSIKIVDIILYVIFTLIFIFWCYIIFSDKNPRLWKILIITSIICIFVIWFMSWMIQSFNI